MSDFHPPLAVMGCGNMGRAIVIGGINAGILDAARIVIGEPDAGQRAKLAESLSRAGAGRVLTLTSAAEAAARLAELDRSVGAGQGPSQSGQVLLAIKPQMLETLAAEVGPSLADRVVISILAGTPGEKLRAALSARIVRAMPNLPASIGRSTTAVCLSSNARPGDDTFAQRIFRGVGREVVAIDENLMNAFTALAGSGPAYVFYLAEAMAEAGVRMGFDRATALRIVRETIDGSGALLGTSTEDPGTLRQAVTSKGGTTEAALKHLNSAIGGGVASVWVEAIQAARDRGEELGRL
jgi:pyrroline-5-carboxylate reductase